MDRSSICIRMYSLVERMCVLYVINKRGAYPGNTSRDIQSGTGFVHNSFLLDYPEKTVYRQPFRLLMDAKVPYDLSHKTSKSFTESMINWECREKFGIFD
jgi:hypothetical protein